MDLSKTDLDVSILDLSNLEIAFSNLTKRLKKVTGKKFDSSNTPNWENYEKRTKEIIAKIKNVSDGTSKLKLEGEYLLLQLEIVKDFQNKFLHLLDSIQ